MSLSASRSSTSFICRSCRALPSKPKITPQIPWMQNHDFSTTPSIPFSNSSTRNAPKVNPLMRAINNARAQDGSTLRIPLLKSGFNMDSIPGLQFWQKSVEGDLIADKSITAQELYETALRYAELAIQGEYGEPARDPNLTAKYGIRLITLYYVQLCLITGRLPANQALQLFGLHIVGTLITVHEYRPAILNTARQRSWKSGQMLTGDILRRKLKEGGDGKGFVDANAATLAGLQCLWEVEMLRGNIGVDGGGGGSAIEPAHAVHPSKMNDKSKVGRAPLSPTVLASIKRKKQEGLQWFRRAIELSTKQSPGTWNWEVSCYIGMVDLYDASSPKERPLKMAASEHLAVRLDNMDGCFHYGMMLPKGSELRETMITKAAMSGHALAQKEMERILLNKLMAADEKGLTEQEIKQSVIMADEWGLMSQEKTSP